MDCQIVCWLLREENVNDCIFVRDDASEKEADAEDNGAKEGDGQGYVLY